MHKNIVIPLLCCQCGLFIHTCVSKSLIVSKDLIFYLIWYNVILWGINICKKSYFLSFYSFLVNFSEKHNGSDRIKLRKWQSWMAWKMLLCKWHSFWMAPRLIFHFIVILFYTERKWIIIKNIATILTLKSKLCGNFSVLMLWMKHKNGQKQLNFQKFHLKWKTKKHFTSPKQRVALRKLFSTPYSQPTPHQIKTYYVSRTNSSTDIRFQSA